MEHGVLQVPFSPVDQNTFRLTCEDFTSWLWLVPKVVTPMGTARSLPAVIGSATLEME